MIAWLTLATAGRPVSWLSQAVTAGDPVLSGWAELGGLGILTGFLAIAVRVLFARETKNLDHERATHKEALAAANARADRLEEEVRELNKLFTARVVGLLADATRTLARTLETDRRDGG